MIDRIWHLRGSVRAQDGVPDEVVLERVVRLLDGQQKPITRRTSATLEFAGPMRWSLVPTMRNLSFGWSAMRDVDKGAFWIEQAPEGRMLRYELRLLRLFYLILIAAILFVVVISLRGHPVFAAAFGILCIIWLYLPSVLLARARILRKIRAAVTYGY